MRVLVNSHRLYIINSGQTRTRVVENPSRVREKEGKISSTRMKNLSTSKVDESALESMRVHESFWPNESESLNFHRLSSSFGRGLSNVDSF